jgi:hypothetical protein
MGVASYVVAVTSCADLRVATLDAGAGAGAGNDDGSAIDPGGGDGGGADAATASEGGKGPCTTPAPDDADNCGRCGHSCVGGACKAGACQPSMLASNRLAPVDIAVQGSFVYWVEQGTAENAGTDGRLSRADVTCKGGATCAKDLVDAGSGFAGLAVNTADVYVASGTLSTGQIQRFAFPSGPFARFASPELGARRIALDVGAAYWVNAGSSPGAGTVRRKFLDGTSDAGVSIATGLDYPAALAVQNGRVYFSVRGQLDTDGAIQACDVTGASPKTIASGQAQPRGVAVDTNFVYWVNRGDGTVRHASLTGGASAVLVPNGVSPNAVAVDADRIYWTEAGTDPDRLDGRVRSSKLDGSDVRMMTTPLPEPLSIALDATAVYVAVRGTSANGYRDGQILKIAKP